MVPTGTCSRGKLQFRPFFLLHICSKKAAVDKRQRTYACNSHYEPAPDRTRYFLHHWDDEGALVNGTMQFSVDLFALLYKPLLEELRIPYLLIYDLWGYFNSHY